MHEVMIEYTIISDVVDNFIIILELCGNAGCFSDMSKCGVELKCVL